MDRVLRDALFLLESERSHDTALQLLAVAGATEAGRAALRTMYGPRTQRPVSLMGLTFPNAVGLAAGYDKGARAWAGLATLGFGHVEIGTVTPKPQPGNPRPRVFRLTEQACLINRLGFPSEGADVVHRRLGPARPYGTVLGVNIGKNKDTPLEEAASDYTALVHAFADVADYLTVNVSSPNTPGLRKLQTGAALTALLTAVVAARDACTERLGRRVPVTVKLAPDLDDADLDDALQAVADAAIDGVIATNTTLDRDRVHGPLAQETGGLSGAALTAKATDVCRRIRARAGDALPLIGVGGIMTPDDAQARLDAGADLVQLYTGVVFGGPGLVRQTVERLAR
ncbi:MAG: quinone-dependent dihydroorotate dehydrogenase [Alphaproteobacteria bacterium]|nr:quinone-dependent dihydroorotate dehydrogenase [Alphaproteobacteria bacterium]